MIALGGAYAITFGGAYDVVRSAALGSPVTLFKKRGNDERPDGGGVVSGKQMAGASIRERSAGARMADAPNYGAHGQREKDEEEFYFNFEGICEQLCIQVWFRMLRRSVYTLVYTRRAGC